MERSLRAEPGVRRVKVSVRTGTVLVLFEPDVERALFDRALARAADLNTNVAGWPESPRSTRAAHAAAVGVSTLLRRVGHPPHARTNGAAAPPAGESTAARPLAALNGLLVRLRGVFVTPSPEQIAPEVATSRATRRWHALEVTEICTELEVDLRLGLPGALADARLHAHGPNALPPPPRRGELEIFFAQLKSTPVLMLAASAVLSGLTGGVADAVAILAVVGINAAIGYVTESGAQRTIAALSSTPHPSVPLRRDGVSAQVEVERVVRGDLLLLSAGVFVCADARVVLAQGLTVDESSLTGESVPVLKTARRIDDLGLPLAERASMVYRGTLVTGGSGMAVVIATGMETEIGHVQALATSVAPRQTPMQQQLDQLGGQLAASATIACIATLGMGLLRGQAPLPMFRTAVSLAVAAVPEGLPTVAMTTLALGLQRLRQDRVIVRALAAVETLGAVQVVCVDKTGTLTVNRMTVSAVHTGLATQAVEAGAFTGQDDRPVTVKQGSDLEQLLRLGVLCSEVELEQHNGLFVLKGSPTESALVQLAIDAGVDVRALRDAQPRIETEARTDARSYMSTLHKGADGALRAVKGRPSEVLALCSAYLENGERRPLGDAERARIEDDNENMAGRALRVLGVAFTDGPEAETHTGDLVFVGLVGMHDPPRDGVDQVIARLRKAGVRTVMITGDQSATAHAVGREIGLSSNGHLEIVDSTQLDQLGPEVLSALAQRADVFARVSPAHKLQIVQALQRAGQVVAMTGDGVNDSPALKAADIGIAMGGGGTAAAREVADVVLEDDDLHALVIAIEQGRTIYGDLRKAVRFILSTNLGEILYTFTGVAAGLGELLTPMQLLWINLLTDVLPELALAVQPPEADVLSRPPRDPARPMFTREDMLRIGGEGTIITAGALFAYLWARTRSGPGIHANSVGFTALTLAQLLHAWSARSETHTIFDREHMARNRWLPIAVGGTMLLQVGANLTPGLRGLLGTTRLSSRDWGLALVAAVGPFLTNEAIKLMLRPKAETKPNLLLPAG